ncbi:MAG: Rne/Rng family ribonuclease [bacterium]|nr:Rne/Rng family ribonuclease [bacterium]
MKQGIYISSMPLETVAAIKENSMVVELHFERSFSKSMIGSIYRGVVKNVLPGIQSAFIDIGKPVNAYIYVSDVVKVVDGKFQKVKDISSGLKVNDVVMVQIAKDPIGTKSMKVTMEVILPGKYLVLMFGSNVIKSSRNIKDKKFISEVESIIRNVAPPNVGFIIRTEAKNAKMEWIENELKFLIKNYESIINKFNSDTKPELLYEEKGIVETIIREYVNMDTHEVVIDDKDTYERASKYVSDFAPHLKDKIHLYKGSKHIFKEYDIEREINNIKKSEIELPSGGYIVIQEMESLTAIDVNTGSYIEGTSQEETVTATNLEAAREIARQIRLRNIGGIVVIDFIDMKNPKNKKRVIEEIKESTSYDKAKVTKYPITSLGLVELTRERKTGSILSLLTTNCNSCMGTGRVLSLETLFIKAVNDILHFSKFSKGRIELHLAPTAKEFFLRPDNFSKLKEVIKQDIYIESEPNLKIDDYRLLIK